MARVRALALYDMARYLSKPPKFKSEEELKMYYDIILSAKVERKDILDIDSQLSLKVDIPLSPAPLKSNKGVSLYLEVYCSL